MKMVKTWSNLEIDNLISLVKEYPALYDESLKETIDKDAKEIIWTAIAKKTGTSNRNCKRKWVSLCLKFQKREEEGIAAVAGQDVEEWPWFESLNFIKKQDLPKNEPKDVAESSEVKPVVVKQEKKNVEPEAKIVNQETNNVRAGSHVNASSNKLFLESLIDDLSSLSLKDQYEFKRKVMGLMESYVSKD